MPEEIKDKPKQFRTLTLTQEEVELLYNEISHHTPFQDNYEDVTRLIIKLRSFVHGE